MPRAQDAGKPTSVYLIEAGPFVKIGVAVDVRKRLRSLMAGMPEAPGEVLLRTFEFNVQAHSVERQLHRHFHKQRVRGEWFRITLNEAAAVLEVVEVPRWEDLKPGKWNKPTHAEAEARVAEAMRRGRDEIGITSTAKDMP